jgi:hypothetical protein
MPGGVIGLGLALCQGLHGFGCFPVAASGSGLGQRGLGLSNNKGLLRVTFTKFKWYGN